jgi:hypothetical protein
MSGRDLAVVVLAAGMAGCSNLPSITDAGECREFQRRGYEKPVLVQDSWIKSVDILREFPAPHFYGVQFHPVPGDSMLKGAKMYLEYRDGTSLTGCKIAYSGVQACTVIPDGMEATGFMLFVSLSASISEVEAIQATVQLWSADLECRDAT